VYGEGVCREGVYGEGDLGNVWSWTNQFMGAWSLLYCTNCTNCAAPTTLRLLLIPATH
jgi:hypothetical protein